MPYGFGLHPFFQNLGGALISTKGKKVMLATDDKIPTGKLQAAAGTQFDLAQAKPAAALRLDTVYYNEDKQISAKITYPLEGFSMEFTMSSEFRHLVVYTPQEQPFFCVEPQTCSTDCHNLYAKGFRQESGLIVVPKGGRRQGFVKLSFKDIVEKEKNK